jgi:hypothetical protein
VSITIESLTEVEQTALDAQRNRFPGRDVGPRSFLGQDASSIAIQVYPLLVAALGIDRDAVPGNETSVAGREKWAFVLGLSNGAGGYGRRVAVAATGGIATLTGAPGTVFADGTQLVASDGVTLLALSGAVTLPGGGSASGSIIATTAGVAGNLGAGAVLQWVTPPVGADSTVTITSALAGGMDLEAPAALLERILVHLQLPPKGGANTDWRDWGLVDGVARIYLYPHRFGIGSVDLVLDAGGEGLGHQPSQAVLDAATAVIQLLRPACTNSFRVLGPYMPTSAALTIRVRIEPAETRFRFDWIDTAGFTVAAYVPGVPPMLTLSADAPQSLIDAIDNATTPDTYPRLQVLATGGTARPVQIRAIGYSGAGSRDIALEYVPLPDGWVDPTAGDAVYAGGPAVDDIADAIFQYVEEVRTEEQDASATSLPRLGPSRVSGFGDAQLTWDDTARVFQLAAIALNTVSSDGRRYAQDLVGTPTINGVAADVQAQDNGTDGPERLYVRHIAVTQ